MVTDHLLRFGPGGLNVERVRALLCGDKRAVREDPRGVRIPMGSGITVGPNSGVKVTTLSRFRIQ